MGAGLGGLGGVRTVADLGEVLRELRRRQARRSGAAELSYRELAARTGWAHSAIGEYLAGRALPPTDRFDVLVLLLGATPAEQGALATARDRVAELRRTVGAARAAPGSPSAPVVTPTAAPTPAAAPAPEAAPAPVATEHASELGSVIGATPAGGAGSVPRELPPATFGFGGRDRELAELDDLLATAETATAPVVVAIVGMAGVGKTALAVSWAHRVRERFVDGQLHVDLRGYDPDRPTPPEQALAALMRGLGVAGADLPRDPDELARRYRSLVAGRRLVVVLDNAASAEQVRPLLPGTPSCFVLVTSRDDLAGLVARDGARRLAVEPLAHAAAVDLLVTLAGRRVSAEPAAAAALARRCARLPLALRIAAELVTARPDATLGDLVDELAERRLDVLDAGDDARVAIRSVFSWSLRHLPPHAAECFRLLGVHPGPDIDPGATAALIGTDAARLLDRLERAHLVQRGHGGRYRMHDLLRAYAAELGTRHPEAAAATTRVLDHYVRTSASAMDTLFPLERDCRPRYDPVPAVANPHDALTWLDAERANLVAAATHAARHGSPAVTGELGRILWRYLDSHAHYQDALAVHSVAAAVAPAGSPDLAEALTNLGIVHWRLGRCERGVQLLHRALTITRATGDRAGEARVLAGLGVLHEQLGHYPASLDDHRAAMAAYRELGDRRRLALVQGNLGVLHWRLGHYLEAIDCHEQAASAGRALGDERIEGYALANLGLVYQQVGRYQEALRSHRRGLAAARLFGDRRGEAETLAGLGVTYTRMKQLPQAVDHLQQALAIATELGNRCQETEALNNLGDALAAMRRFDAALRHHTAAHALTVGAGDRYERARALDGMATSLDGLGLPDDATARRRQARSLYADLGLTPMADPGALPRHA